MTASACELVGVRAVWRNGSATERTWTGMHPGTPAGVAACIAGLGGAPLSGAGSTAIRLRTVARPVTAETVAAAGVLLGTPLLILLGAPDALAAPIRLVGRGDTVQVFVPRPPDRELIDVLPLVWGALAAFLRDHPRAVLPRSIVSVPALAARRRRGVSLAQWRGDEPVFRRGRLTRVATVVPSTTHWTTVQQPLTVVAFWAEADTVRMAGAERTAVALSRALGEEQLPLDRFGLRSGPPPEERLRVELASAHRRPLLVVLEVGQRVRTPVRFIAEALSRTRQADVVVCPWYRVGLDGDGVTIQGGMFRAVGGELQAFRQDTPRDVDVMFFHSMSGTGAAAPGEELQFLERLEQLGIARRTMRRNIAVDRLMREASLRGLVTSAAGPDRFWASKDALDNFLRAHRRATGRDVRRPETHAVELEQVPTILRSFARRGLDCIVKPAHGARGENLQLVRADAVASWRPAGPARDYAVQALVPRPALIDGAKTDLRCHVVVDVDQRSRSGLIGTILARRAGVAYTPGWDDTEIANVLYQHRARLPAEIRPIEQWAGVPLAMRMEIMERLTELVEDLLDAHRWWANTLAPTEDWAPRRVMLWGVDVLVAEGGSGLETHLLEVNVFPQLKRTSEPCNAAVATMLADEYVPALLRAATGVESGARDGAGPTGAAIGEGAAQSGHG